ncbi:unnamed protein product [Discula destructiva]
MSSKLGVEKGPFAVPSFTETDLASFHEAHFSQAALDAFATDFLNPDNAQSHGEVQQQEDEKGFYGDGYYYDEEDDDELGYYPDGAKRTLTDEQIAMFRHSELQALQRARDKGQQNDTNHDSFFPAPDAEEGELPPDQDGGGEKVQVLVAKATSKKKKNNKKKRGSGKGVTKPWEPDPERRKRTWDVVETGLDGLDYGETGTSAPSVEHVASRRRITYDDA